MVKHAMKDLVVKYGNGMFLFVAGVSSRVYRLR